MNPPAHPASPPARADAVDIPPPTRVNTCAVVVTYHPDDGLPQRVRALAGQFARIFIVDNGSGAATGALLDRLEDVSAGETVRNAENLGIATALNQGLTLAAHGGFAWAVTLDQDSTVLPEFAEILFQTYHAHPRRGKVGAVGSLYRDPEIDLTRHQRVPPTSARYREVRAVITSGCLTSVDAWSAAGAFRDDLFIDCVDEEFCLRLRRRGFLVIQTVEAGFVHRLGETREYRLLGRTLLATNHSSLRRYYMTRNAFMLIAANVFTEPLWAARKLQRQLFEWLGIGLAEGSKATKFRAILLGLWHALLGRKGRISTRLGRWLAEP